MNTQSKSLSCGIILVNKTGHVLMQHVTGQSHWDIPKGTKNPLERESEAALRELKEETGIVINEENLTDLSWHIYNSYKDLWLFIAEMPNIDIKDLKCTSNYIWNGEEVPEADEYAFIHYQDVQKFCCNSLARVFQGGIEKDIEKFLKFMCP